MLVIYISARWNRPAILTIILAAVRVIAGVHFIRDVIAGIAVGILCGFIGLWIL